MGGAPALAHWKVERILPFFFRLIEKEDFPSELKEEVDELLSLTIFLCLFTYSL